MEVVLPVTVLELAEVVDAEDDLEEALEMVTNPVEDTEVELEDAPLMWNGNEYWKVAGLESSEILNP